MRNQNSECRSIADEMKTYPRKAETTRMFARFLSLALLFAMSSVFAAHDDRRELSAWLESQKGKVLMQGPALKLRPGVPLANLRKFDRTLADELLVFERAHESERNYVALELVDMFDFLSSIRARQAMGLTFLDTALLGNRSKAAVQRDEAEAFERRAVVTEAVRKKLHSEVDRVVLALAMLKGDPKRGFPSSWVDEYEWSGLLKSAFQYGQLKGAMAQLGAEANLMMTPGWGDLERVTRSPGVSTLWTAIFKDLRKQSTDETSRDDARKVARKILGPELNAAMSKQRDSQPEAWDDPRWKKACEKAVAYRKDLDGMRPEIRNQIEEEFQEKRTTSEGRWNLYQRIEVAKNDDAPQPFHCHDVWSNHLFEETHPKAENPKHTSPPAITPDVITSRLTPEILGRLVDEAIDQAEENLLVSLLLRIREVDSFRFIDRDSLKGSEPFQAADVKETYDDVLKMDNPLRKYQLTDAQENWFWEKTLEATLIIAPAGLAGRLASRLVLESVAEYYGEQVAKKLAVRLLVSLFVNGPVFGTAITSLETPITGWEAWRWPNYWRSVVSGSVLFGALEIGQEVANFTWFGTRAPFLGTSAEALSRAERTALIQGRLPMALRGSKFIYDFLTEGGSFAFFGHLEASLSGHVTESLHWYEEWGEALLTIAQLQLGGLTTKPLDGIELSKPAFVQRKTPAKELRAPSQPIRFSKNQVALIKGATGQKEKSAPETPATTIPAWMIHELQKKSSESGGQQLAATHESESRLSESKNDGVRPSEEKQMAESGSAGKRLGTSNDAKELARKDIAQFFRERDRFKLGLPDIVEVALVMGQWQVETAIANLPDSRLSAVEKVTFQGVIVAYHTDPTSGQERHRQFIHDLKQLPFSDSQMRHYLLETFIDEDKVAPLARVHPHPFLALHRTIGLALPELIQSSKDRFLVAKGLVKIDPEILLQADLGLTKSEVQKVLLSMEEGAAVFVLYLAENRAAFTGKELHRFLNRAFDSGSGGVIAAHLHEWKILTRDQKFQIVMQLNRWEVSSVELPELGLTPGQNYKFAVRRFAFRPDSIPNWLNTLFSSEERERLAADVVSSLDFEFPGRLRSLHIYFYVNHVDTGEIAAHAIANDPEAAILALSRDHELTLAPDIETLEAQLKGMIGNFDIPSYVPTLAPILWDRVRDREIGLRLLAEGAASTIHSYRIIRNPPRDSTALFSLAIGIPDPSLRSADIPKRMIAEIFSYGLDLQAHLRGNPAFADVTFDPIVFARSHISKFRDFLEALRALKSLRGNDPAAWDSIRSELQLLNIHIGPEKLRELIDRTRDLVKSDLERLFRREKIAFKYEKFLELRKKWGDIEPILTLIARFQGRPAWRREIVELARVFKATLGNKFEDYKFSGDPERPEDQESAAKQLAVLKTKRQRDGWMRPRAKISVHRAVASSSSNVSDTFVADLRESLSVGLLKHVGYQLAPSLPSELIRLVTDARQDPKATLSELRTQLHGIQGPNFQLTLFRLLAGEMNYLEPSEIKSVGKFLSFLLRRDPGLFPALSREQIGHDLLKLNQAIGRWEDQGKQEEALVLSVISHDPKFLLTIGNLVDTSSCQDYRRGSYIQTLLGYVIDANTQGMASFALSSNEFNSLSDYNAVKLAVEEGAFLKVTFDGNLRTARFTLANEKTIETKALGHAYLRNIIKLGQTKDNEPAVFLEPDYWQTHAFLEQMRLQHRELLADVATDTNAQTVGNFLVVGPRNDGGSYSDLRKGVVKKDYEVTIGVTP